MPITAGNPSGSRSSRRCPRGARHSSRRAAQDAVAGLDEDYRFVRMADILSLIFCKGWRQPFDHDGRHISVDANVLTVTPEPFGGARIPLRLAARRIPRRAYASDEDLRSTIAAAPRGHAGGNGGRRVGLLGCARPQGRAYVSRASDFRPQPCEARRSGLRVLTVDCRVPSPVSSSRPMPRILVVEDDTDIAELDRALPRPAPATPWSGWRRARDVLPRLRREPVDLVILDIMLPGLDGLRVCDAMRADPATAAIPVIMLTARGEEADRISGLELGADDYVTKPFSPKELIARVTALLRRLSRPATGTAPDYGPITIDRRSPPGDARRRGGRLTAKEFLLLQYLVQHRGRVLSRDLLLTDVWGYQYTGGTRTVDVHVRRLREKLPVLADAIETIKQFGYKLVGPRRDLPHPALPTSLAAAALTLVVATILVSWSVRRTIDERIERVAGQRGAAGGRDAVASSAPRRPRSSTPRRMRSAGWSARASRSSRRTAPSSATRELDADGAAHARESRRPAGNPAGAARRPRRRAALQHDARRPTCSTSRCRCSNPDAPLLARGPARAAADRASRAARGGAADCARRARRRPPRRAGAGLGRVGAPQPPRARDCRGRRALCRRRLVAAGARLRRRRDRHGGARARRLGARDRPPRRRARRPIARGWRPSSAA